MEEPTGPQFSEITERDEPFLEEPIAPFYDADATTAEIDRILAELSGWSTPTSPIDCEGKRWTPHLVGDGRALHVHLADSLPRWVAARLRAASTVRSVCIALKIESLYDEELLRLLGDVNAEVLVLDGRRSKFRPTHYLAVLADESVPVSLKLRQDLGSVEWGRRGFGSNYEKGHHFEWLLAFLLSQVNGFKIFERNFRADTDEIDIVIQVDNNTSRCWSQSGVPFVIVEGKNWTRTIGSSVVSLLIRKLETRRGRARIGILFATSSFSGEARDEELKEAKGDYCVAMLGPDEIEEWIAAVDPDDYLDRLVGKAMLR